MSGPRTPSRAARIAIVAVIGAAAVLVDACTSSHTGRSGDGAVSQAVLARPATGFIPVEGGRVWYQIHGTGTRTPLLVLHGGPGIPHDYLANLALLGDERPVIFYDQLGCGRSDRPDDPALWTRERFARELATVRAALGLDEVVLYGHSWGSILAVDYLSGEGGGGRPAGVRGAILAGPALSIPRWLADSRLLLAALPPDVGATIEEGERTGQVDTDAFQAAMHTYYQHYVCRLDPWPPELDAAFAGMGAELYATMAGPTEFTITGPIKDLDVTGRLGDLHLPLLFICGEHDEATPETTRYYASLAPGSDVAVIEGASHVANFEQPQAYLRTLRDWLDENRL